jgi:phosphatidylserine/phosphatidylglycerophosphate/cardiolipin synthase-like enzyme
VNRAEVIGGVLHATMDPEVAAELLYDTLRGAVLPPKVLQEHRLEPALIDAAARALGDVDDVEKLRWCRAGAAWVLGRRSARGGGQSWDPVVTYPAGLRLPEGTERTTGETIVGIITAARSLVRIASPYVDREAIDYLAGAIAGAASRGTSARFVVTRSRRAIEAARHARECFAGLRPEPVIRFASEFSIWPHLKVVSADGSSAYVGSANLTGAALRGRSLELGLLVRGPGVALIDNVLDRIVLEPESQ